MHDFIIAIFLIPRVKIPVVKWLAANISVNPSYLGNKPL